MRFTARPDTDRETGGVLTYAGGAPDGHTATSDDNDSTYAQSSAAATFVMGYPSPAIPSDAYFKKEVRLRARIGGVASFRSCYIRIGAEYYYFPDYYISTFTPITVEIGRHSLPVGITNFMLGGDAKYTKTDLYAGATQANIVELYLDFIAVAPPIATATGPTGTVNTNRPTITWANSVDTDGGVVSKARVKVFTESQTLDGGFDPDVTTPVSSSGEIASATFWHVPEAIADGDYVAYVSIAQTINGADFWGAWDSVGFATDAPEPNPPSLTATAESVAARIRLEATPNDGGSDPIAHSQGPQSPSAAANDNSNGGVFNWANPTNVFSSNNTYAMASTSGGGGYKWLKTTGYGFSLPADATVTGITVEIEGHEENDDGLPLDSVKLVKAGAVVGSDRGGFDIGPSDQYYTVGGSADMWGTAWTAADVNDVGFGVAMASVLATEDILIDHVRITVHYDTPAGVSDTTDMQLQRSDDAENWTDLRTVIGDGFINIGEIAWDFEAGNSVLTYYRARARHIETSTGDIIWSDWSLYASAIWASDDYWLKHPNKPEMSISANELTSYPGKNTSGRKGDHNILGKKNPIVTSDVRGGDTGTIRLAADLDAEREAIDALLNEQVACLLQLSAGDGEPDRWMSFGDQGRERYVDHSSKHKTQDELPWTAVDRPPGNIVEWPPDDGGGGSGPSEEIVIV